MKAAVENNFMLNTLPDKVSDKSSKLDRLSKTTNKKDTNKNGFAKTFKKVTDNKVTDDNDKKDVLSKDDLLADKKDDQIKTKVVNNLILSGQLINPINILNIETKSLPSLNDNDNNLLNELGKIVDSIKNSKVDNVLLTNDNKENILNILDKIKDLPKNPAFDKVFEKLINLLPKNDLNKNLDNPLTILQEILVNQDMPQTKSEDGLSENKFKDNLSLKSLLNTDDKKDLSKVALQPKADSNQSQNQNSNSNSKELFNALFEGKTNLLKELKINNKVNDKMEKVDQATDKSHLLLPQDFSSQLDEIQTKDVTPKEDLRPLTKDVFNQIVSNARLMRNNNNTQMVINLHPDHLGALALKISVEANGLVSASFHTDNSQVRAMIETSLMQLRQDLQAQGVKVDNINVYSSLGDLLQHQQNRENPSQQGNKKSNYRIEATDAVGKMEDMSILDVDQLPIEERDSSYISNDGVDYKI